MNSNASFADTRAADPMDAQGLAAAGMLLNERDPVTRNGRRRNDLSISPNDDYGFLGFSKKILDS